MSAAVMGLIGLLPGIPILPFALLGRRRGLARLHARRARTRPKPRRGRAPKPAPRRGRAAAAEEPIAEMLQDRRPEDRDRLRAPAARQRHRRATTA